MFWTIEIINATKNSNDFDYACNKQSWIPVHCEEQKKNKYNNTAWAKFFFVQFDIIQELHPRMYNRFQYKNTF